MMKRIFFLCLIALLLMGCQVREQEPVDSYQFYYPRVHVLYGSDQGVFLPEARDASLMERDMASILTNYLQGPQSPELYSPFPEGTHLTRVEQKGNALYVGLSKPFFDLKDMKMTLACTALSQTCFNLTSVQFLVILKPDGNNYRILQRDTVIFSDSNDTLNMDIGTEIIPEE